jgi:hypothetical protein
LLFIQNRAPVVEEMRDVPQADRRSPQAASHPQLNPAETPAAEPTVLNEAPSRDQYPAVEPVVSGPVDSSLEPVPANLEQPGVIETPVSIPAGSSGLSGLPRTSTSTRRPHEGCIVCETAGQCSSHARPCPTNEEIWALVSTSQRSTGDDEVEEIPCPQPTSSSSFKAAYLDGDKLQAAIDEAAERAELDEFTVVSQRSIELMEVKTCLVDTLCYKQVLELVPCCSVFSTAQGLRQTS